MNTHGSGWVGVSMLIGCPLVYFIVGWEVIIGAAIFFTGWGIVLAGAKKMGG